MIKPLLALLFLLVGFIVMKWLIATDSKQSDNDYDF